MQGHPRAEMAQVAARRAKLVAYRRARVPYREFYEELGYATPSAASRDFNRVLEDNLAEVRTSTEAYREAALLELDDLAAAALKVMHSQHLVTTQGGKVVTHPETGEFLIDHAPKLAAIHQLLKIQDRQAKLLGLDAAQKVEVFTIDALTAEAERLSALLAAGDSQVGTRTGDPATAG